MRTDDRDLWYSCPMGRLYREDQLDAIAQFQGPCAKENAAKAAEALNNMLKQGKQNG